MVELKEEIMKIMPDIETEKLDKLLDLIWMHINEYANYQTNQAVNSAINSLSRFS